MRIASLTVNGRAHERSWISHGELASGAHLRARVTAANSDWATDAAAVPPSVAGSERGPWRDLAHGETPLVDDAVGERAVTLAAGAGVVCRLAESDLAPELYTLTCGPDPAGAPGGWRCETSVDGRAWVVVDERAGEGFEWPWQLRPFAFQREVPAGSAWFRLTALEPGELAQLQVLA